MRLALCALLVAATAVAAPIDHVDPFIGTGGHGHTFPGATVPFGMVQLSPDTRLSGWDGCSGYHFSDDVVYGFSHTHLSGTGVADYCDVLLMPVTGEVAVSNEYPGGYPSKFSKDTEQAAPGWYAVRLEDNGIDVELTATARTGLQRYVYPAGVANGVVLDLHHRDRVLDSWVRVVSDTEIEGLRRSSSWAKDQWVFFVARFSKPFTTDMDSLQGEDVKAVFGFGDTGGELLVKVGISAVDVDGARRNLDAEQPGWDFAGVRTAATDAWNEALGKIAVEGGTDAQQTIFYSALYHTMIAPNLFSDVDGRYRGLDQEIHRAEGYDQYTVFSLWDTFRAAHPLYTLIEPERTGDFVRSMLAHYEDGGRLPVWELAGNETDCMIGYHSVSAISDAWAKGLRDFDGELALEAMVHSARLPDRGLDAYQELGYIPADHESESVSKTLEYAYDDWCIARMAESLGRDDLRAEFDRRAQAWRHLYDPQTTYLRGRENGGWLTPFDPRRVDFHHTEANGWQYRFCAPHDVEGMIDRAGGGDAFVARLDSLFTADEATTGRTQADITGLIGQYAHGNEPSHHVAWLYHYAGRPDKGARYVARILDELYAPAPDGLSGNEDCGQMSAWYVLSALGLYQVAPGDPAWLLGAPVFDRAVVQLGGGRELVITAEGDGPYVDGVSVDGEAHDASWISHEALTSAGTLAVVRADEPSVWGFAASARPRSRIPGEPVIAAPWMFFSSVTFRDSLPVYLGGEEQLELRRPSGRWMKMDPCWVIIRESGELALRSVRPDGSMSPVTTGYFHRIPHDWTVEVHSEPNSQYTAGGPSALVDGLRGPRDWRTGRWQGYQDQDFEAVVDLGEERKLGTVGAGFLQDMRSWIWMPTEIVVEVSTDGETFTESGRVTHQIPDDVDQVFRENLVLDAGGVTARYVKVRAINYGTIPEWHPGAGGEAFIFVDEVLIESAD
ncbi:MAG: glycoside hydrolase family 92 protein [bacterium]|nr:glycoside hydrolase family 92 protein [bacterium]